MNNQIDSLPFELSELQICFSPLPLSVLCALCGEYTGAMKRGLTNHSRLRLRAVSLPATERPWCRR